MKHLQNQNGNTLIENIIAVFLLAVFSLLVSMLMLAAANQLATVRTEDAYINEVSTAVETATDLTRVASAGTTSETVVKSNVISGALTFDIVANGITNSIPIDGTYVYDQAESRLGEFVREDTP